MTTKKRYQIFISSTYEDLPVERQEVFRAIMKMGHIPSGMEFFPAFGTTQLEYIKRIIDRSDYYVVISAGRYGSLTPEGISFTEAEYDYAVQKQLHVIAMLHRNPEAIPVGKVQIDPDAQTRLEAFKQRLRKNRGRGTYETPHELASEVVLALNEAFDSFPAVGWIRGDQGVSQTLIRENLNLRDEILRLREAQPVQPRAPTNVSNLRHKVELRLIRKDVMGYPREQTFLLTWRDILLHMGPSMITPKSEAAVLQRLANALSPPRIEFGTTSEQASLDEDSADQVKIQLLVLGLVALTTNRSGAALWSLTEVGRNIVLEHKSQKRSKVLKRPKIAMGKKKRKALR